MPEAEAWVVAGPDGAPAMKALGIAGIPVPADSCGAACEAPTARGADRSTSALEASLAAVYYPVAPVIVSAGSRNMRAPTPRRAMEAREDIVIIGIDADHAYRCVRPREAAVIARAARDRRCGTQGKGDMGRTGHRKRSR